MRFIGILMILAGLLAMFGYPYYHQAFTNFEIGEYTVYDKASGYTDQSILLAPEDAPINIAFTAIADTVEVNAGSGSTVLVDIKTGAQALRSEIVRFSGPPRDTNVANTSGIEMNVDLNPLPIANSGIYSFEFSDASSNDIPFSSITMTITGLVIGMDEQIPSMGFGIVGMGFLLLIYSAIRKMRRGRNARKRSKTSQIGRRVEVEPPVPEKLKKQAFKWGRGDAEE